MEALGPVLILVSIPLMLRWVPQNRIYGFRIAATLRNRSVWYDTNARAGLHFFLAGMLLVLLELTLPTSVRNPVLSTVAIASLVAVTVVNWRAANRLERERTATT
jgi:uncharacterized membrane protein